MDSLFSWYVGGLISGLQFNDFREILGILRAKGKWCFSRNSAIQFRYNVLALIFQVESTES